MPSLDRLTRLLHALPAESAHGAALRLLDLLHGVGLVGSGVARSPVHCLGLEFASPVGLAAGLDKNADHVDALGALGFGFIEVGTVTPRPQPGNPRPRLFRIPAHRAIINRMGFNNLGVDHAVRQLERRKYGGVVGVNIGKNRDTPIERAVDDYRHCLERVHGVADYVTVNISSPNTPGLRSLQGGEALDDLLAPLVELRDRLDRACSRHVPLLVKIAPDLDRDGIDAFCRAIERHGIDGVIATNTTADHAAVAGSRHADEEGGLSGAPLMGPSTEVLQRLRAQLGESRPLLGVGGICSAEDAAEKRRAGADLVQLYTGLIYRGPGLIDEAVRGFTGQV